MLHHDDGIRPIGQVPAGHDGGALSCFERKARRTVDGDLAHAVQPDGIELRGPEKIGGPDRIAVHARAVGGGQVFRRDQGFGHNRTGGEVGKGAAFGREGGKVQKAADDVIDGKDIEKIFVHPYLHVQRALHDSGGAVKKQGERTCFSVCAGTGGFVLIRCQRRPSFFLRSVKDTAGPSYTVGHSPDKRKRPFLTGLWRIVGHFPTRWRERGLRRPASAFLLNLSVTWRREKLRAGGSGKSDSCRTTPVCARRSVSELFRTFPP